MRICLIILLCGFLCSCNQNKPKEGKYIPTYKKIDISSHLIDSLIEEKRGFDAIFAINDIIVEDTSPGELYYKRGFCFIMMGMLDSAKRDFLIAHKFGFKKSLAMYYEAAAYTIEGNYAKALDFLDSSLIEDRSDTDVINMRKIVLGKLDSIRAAK